MDEMFYVSIKLIAFRCNNAFLSRLYPLFFILAPSCARHGVTLEKDSGSFGSHSDWIDSGAKFVPGCMEVDLCSPIAVLLGISCKEGCSNTSSQSIAYNTIILSQYFYRLRLRNLFSQDISAVKINLKLEEGLLCYKLGKHRRIIICDLYKLSG